MRRKLTNLRATGKMTHSAGQRRRGTLNWTNNGGPETCILPLARRPRAGTRSVTHPHSSRVSAALNEKTPHGIGYVALSRPPGAVPAPRSRCRVLGGGLRRLRPPEGTFLTHFPRRNHTKSRSSGAAGHLHTHCPLPCGVFWATEATSFNWEKAGGAGARRAVRRDSIRTFTACKNAGAALL